MKNKNLENYIIKLLRSLDEGSIFTPGKNFRDKSYLILKDVIFSIFKDKEIRPTQIYLYNLFIKENQINSKYFIDKIEVAKGIFLYDYAMETLDGKAIARGTSFSNSEAFGKCLGEFIERFYSRNISILDSENIIYASQDELAIKNKSFFEINSLPKHIEEAKDVMSSDKLVWVKNLSLSGKDTLVPAQLIYWDFRVDGIQEKEIRELNTSGIGFGPTEKYAVESAYDEVVQRHVFFDYWYKSKPTKQITIDGAGIISKDILAFLDIFKLEVEVLFLEDKSFNSKTFVAVLKNKYNDGVYLGASTSGDFKKAINRSVMEAISIFTWVKRADGQKEYVYSKYLIDKVKLDFTDNRINDRERILVWSSGVIPISEFSWFFNPKDKISLSSIMSRSNNSDKENSKDKNYINYLFNSRFFEENNLFVSRCVIPNSFHLNLAEHTATPVLNGLIPKNTFPHPFP